VDEEQGCQDDYVKPSREGGGSCFWKHLSSLNAMLWARFCDSRSTSPVRWMLYQSWNTLSVSKSKAELL